MEDAIYDIPLVVSPSNHELVLRQAQDERPAACSGRCRRRILQKFLNGCGERVDFLERRVNIRSHAESLIILTLDRRGDDAVLRPEKLVRLRDVDTLEAHIREPPGLIRLPAAEDLDAWMFFEPRDPAIREIAKARRLSLGAYRLMKREGFGNRVVIRSRMRADLFEFANVLR